MPWDNSQDKFESKPDSLYPELQEIAQDSKELQDEIQCFEYKNKSKNWEYYVFSYNTIAGEKANDIKRKYINQYWWSIEWLLITDITWKEISSSEFKSWEKIYLKTKISNHPKPIEFKNIGKSWEIKKSCTIKFPWWDTTSIKQIYQDEFNKVIENDKFVITDDKWNVYDDNYKFKVWETIHITIKKEPVTDTKVEDENEKEKLNWQSKYKEMIENQKGLITHWNRQKSEITLTFDDGHWENDIKDILNTLKSSGIHATFFILWECLVKTPELWKQAIKEWHQICCHTFSHIYLSNNSNTTDMTIWLNKNINISNRINNVKSLLWNNYFEKIKSETWSWFPQKIKSTTLLRTEILMWEAQIKKTLWEEYLNNLKQNYPFFRFPGWNGSRRNENIAVLKELWYLSIYWSDDKPTSSPDKPISNWSIPLFHFNPKDRNNIKTYINNMKIQNKKPRLLSEILVP